MYEIDEAARYQALRHRAQGIAREMYHRVFADKAGKMFPRDAITYAAQCTQDYLERQYRKIDWEFDLIH